ncbi:hypothetical protein HYV69_03090 [Candidatus Uhrbacteria bacterium]|nr:hypothetical protein [Candidatus Uhrbacteria bacterium]
MALVKEAEVKKILTAYNGSVDEGSQLNVDEVCAKLAKAGGGLSAAAKEMSYEDIEGAGIPKAVARAISKVWRGDGEKPAKLGPEVQIGGVEGTFEALAFAMGNIGAFGDKPLLKVYEPLGRDDVTGELRKRSGDKPFIAFSDKQTLTVDVEASYGNLQLLKQGVEIGTNTVINGKLTELFRAGELPDLALPICPVHGCHLIGDGEFCKECNFSWSGVSTEVRELAWCHVQNVLAEVPGSQDARLKQILAALSDAKDQYWSSATLELEKLKATGQPIVLVKPVKRPGRSTPSRR